MLAKSYLAITSTTAGGAVEGAASRKEAKYQALARMHTFIPLSFETLGPINSKGISSVNSITDSQHALATSGRQHFFSNDFCGNPMF